MGCPHESAARPEIVEDRLDWRIGEASGSLQLESVFRVIG